MSNKQMLAILLFKILTRILSGAFSAFMFVVFNDLYGITAGLIALIIGLATSSAGANQLEFLLNTAIFASLAKKSNIDISKIQKNKEDLFIQIGESDPVKIELENKN